MPQHCLVICPVHFTKHHGTDRGIFHLLVHCFASSFPASQPSPLVKRGALPLGRACGVDGPAIEATLRQCTARNTHSPIPHPHAHYTHSARTRQAAASSSLRRRRQPLFFVPRLEQARPPHGCQPISPSPLIAAVAARRVAPSHQKQEPLSTPLYVLCLCPLLLPASASCAYPL